MDVPASLTMSGSYFSQKCEKMEAHTLNRFLGFASASAKYTAARLSSYEISSQQFSNYHATMNMSAVSEADGSVPHSWRQSKTVPFHLNRGFAKVIMGRKGSRLTKQSLVPLQAAQHVDLPL
jgi:hypothetical protein